MFGSLVVRNDHRDDGQRPTAATLDRFAHLGRLQELSDEDVRARLNAAYKVGVALDRKFEAGDLADNGHLMEATELFAQRYEGDFGFMLSMQHDLGLYGSLTPGKAAAVLNCLMAEARRKLVAKRTAAGTVAEGRAWEARHPSTATGVAPVAQEEPPVAVPDGTYTVAFADGEHRTYRLQTLRPDEAARYGQPATAQHVALLIGPDNENSFGRMGIVVGQTLVRRWGVVRVYEGPVASPDLLSRAEAGLAVLLGSEETQLTQYGLAYALASGRCSRCGRKLTVPASIHQGMGPECATR